MKKVLVVVLLLMGVLLVNANEIVMKANFNANLKTKVKLDNGYGSEKYGMKNNISLEEEYFFKINEKLYLGGGLGYDKALKFDDMNLDINLMPVYMTGKYKFEYEKNLELDPKVFYIGLNFGRTFLRMEDLNEAYGSHSGMYYSLFAGVEYGNVIVELKYSKIEFAIGGEGFEDKIEMPRISLGLGIKFNVK